MPLDRHGDFVVATDLRRRGGHGLDLETEPLGVFHIHAKQVPGPDGRLVSSGSGPNLHDDVLGIVGVGRDEGDLDPLFENFDLGFELSRKSRHVWVLRHIPRLLQIGMGTAPATDVGDDVLELRMPLSQLGQV